MEHNILNGKVGIVTLQGKSNYGNRLQNYAVVKVYEKKGYEAVTLLRKYHPTLTRRMVEGVRRLSHLGKTLHVSPRNCERQNAFERFDSNIEFLQVDETDSNLSKAFDFFSVGSDQVWNLGRMSDNDDWYYLRFAHPDQRISLAPSIGVSQLDEKQAMRLAKGVQGFRHLSVRERSGAYLIERCSGRKARVICDPTLALSAKEWRGIEDKSLVPTGKYVFAYLLGGVGEESREALRSATERNSIPVVLLSDKALTGEPPAGPAEFIALIDGATHVVTDSFHAAVFASLFEVPLTIVHREGGLNMFSRLEQLSEMLGIEHKVYNSEDYDFSRAGDYEGVLNAIERERERFMSYLESCLNA